MLSSLIKYMKELQLRPLLCVKCGACHDCDFSNILHWLNTGFQKIPDGKEQMCSTWSQILFEILRCWPFSVVIVSFCVLLLVVLSCSLTETRPQPPCCLDRGCRFLLSVHVCGVCGNFITWMATQSVVKLTHYLFASGGSFVDHWIIVVFVSFILLKVFNSPWNKMLSPFKPRNCKVTRKVFLASTRAARSWEVQVTSS